MTRMPLPAMNDPEAGSVDPRMPRVIDAHVHLFPAAMFRAIWDWFDHYGWPIRYRLGPQDVIDYLTDRGVSHVVGLLYSHRPGLAENLNDFMANLCATNRHTSGLATIYPSEPHATQILEKAFESGLQGLKLHAHVQGFDLDADYMTEIYDVCAAYDKPLIAHVGREPRHPTYPYPADPYAICSLDRVERLIRAYPALRVCVPHLGADEYEPYRLLLERYDNLWLDTTMVVADYLPDSDPPPLDRYRADRVLYGADFPNIPYAWDRELKAIQAMGLSEERLQKLLAGNAIELFSLPIA